MVDVVTSLDTCAAPGADAERVAPARERLISPEDGARLAQLFRLLGDATRTRLLLALLAERELCVCELAATVGASESTVSHALRLLRTAGVVRNRREGRMVYYRLADAHVRSLLDLSREHLSHEAPGGPV